VLLLSYKIGLFFLRCDKNDSLGGRLSADVGGIP